jgi:hypothetical protein
LVCAATALKSLGATGSRGLARQLQNVMAMAFPSKSPWQVPVLALNALLMLGACAAADGDVSLPLGGSDDNDDAEAQPIIGNPSSAASFPEAVLIDIHSTAGGPVTSICSGVLVAPRVVVTAGHCAAGTGRTFDVSAPHASPPQKAHSTFGRVYDYTGDPDREFFEHDVGVVMLSASIDLPFYPPIATQALGSGSKVSSVGRIQAGSASNDSLFVSAPFAVYLGDAIGYPVAYASYEKIAEKGDSGGPVYRGDGTARSLVAVNSGLSRDKQYLLYARLDRVSQWLQQEIGQAAGGTATPPASTPSNPVPQDPTDPPPDPPPPDPPPGGSCAHDPCTIGAALPAWCDNCATIVCELDSYCCTVDWDESCVDDAKNSCGATCL